MICLRCEQYIPRWSRSKANGYCKHCFNAILKNNPDLEFING